MGQQAHTSTWRSYACNGSSGSDRKTLGDASKDGVVDMIAQQNNFDMVLLSSVSMHMETYTKKCYVLVEL